MSPKLSPRTRIGACTVLVLTVALATAGCAAKTTATSTTTTPNPTTTTSSPNAQRAAAYVASSLKDGDHIEGKFGPDRAQTPDGAPRPAARQCPRADPGQAG